MTALPIDTATVVNFVYYLFSAVRSQLLALLQATLFRTDSELALQYADGITLLVTLTAVWLVLELAVAAKKIIRVIVMLGWLLLIVSLAISVA